VRFVLALTLLACASSLLVSQEPPTSEKPRPEYVCPMPEHPQVFDKPGMCPRCGMRLVDRKALQSRRSVAILVFNGVQIIDYAAPYEVFGQAHFNVFTVGPTTDSLTTAMGLKLTPAYSFDDAPPADILVLPGGDVDLEDKRIIDWVRSRAGASEVVLSVCNGAFWLAKAGLLDGLTATTFHRAIDDLQAMAPKTHVVRDRRFVDNGRIVTSAGLTSGMDSSLHVLDRLLGRDKAQEIALQLEYDWRPDSKYARANLADRYLPPLDLGDNASFDPTSSVGDLDHWRTEGILKTREVPRDLLARVSEQLVGKAGWRPLPGAAAKGYETARKWRFSDERGQPWLATMTLTPLEAPDSLKFSLILSSSGPTDTSRP
jgi:putative intracellular protease/amidase